MASLQLSKAAGILTDYCLVFIWGPSNSAFPDVEFRENEELF